MTTKSRSDRVVKSGGRTRGGGRKGPPPVIPDYTSGGETRLVDVSRNRKSRVRTPKKKDCPAVLQVLEQLSSSLLICGFSSVYAAMRLIGFSTAMTHHWFRNPESTNHPKLWHIQAIAQLCGMQIMLVPIRDIDTVAGMTDTYLREIARGETIPHGPVVQMHPVERDMRVKIEAKLERLRALAGDVITNGRRGAVQDDPSEQSGG